MAQDHKDEKIVYVGDSRVRKTEKNNVPRDYSAYPGKTEAFVPNFLLKEWMVGAVVLVGFMVLIIAQDPPLGYPADPTDTSFIPMPDWYFLFLYQMLKYPYMSEQFTVFGAVIAPGLLFGGLLLAPFLDTSKHRQWYKRPIASGLMFVSLIAVFYLTFIAWDYYQNELETLGIVPEHIERAELIKQGQIDAGQATPAEEQSSIVAEDSNGFELYQASTCMSCHANDLSGTAAPGLIGVGDKYTREEIEDIMRNGLRTMPVVWEDNLDAGLTEDDLIELSEWLALQTAENLEAQQAGEEGAADEGSGNEVESDS